MERGRELFHYRERMRKNTRPSRCSLAVSGRVLTNCGEKASN